MNTFSQAYEQQLFMQIVVHIFNVEFAYIFFLFIAEIAIWRRPFRRILRNSRWQEHFQVT